MSFQCVEGLHITVATSWGIPALTETSPLCFLALTVKISMTKNPYAKSQRERELSESASSKKAPQNRQISFVSIETTKMLLIIFPRFFLLCHICHISHIPKISHDIRHFADKPIVLLSDLSPFDLFDLLRAHGKDRPMIHVELHQVIEAYPVHVLASARCPFC